MHHSLTLSQAIISIKRLTRFLSCSEHKSKLEKTAGSASSYISNDQSEFTHEDKAVVFHDSCCSWSSSDEEQLNLVLNHVTLAIPKGSFVAVIGEVRYVGKDLNLLIITSYPVRFVCNIDCTTEDGQLIC